MKLNGRTLVPNIETVVIPRPDGNLVFMAQAVLNYDDFNALCPEPTPPSRMLPGGVTKLDVEDATYKEDVTKWGENRFHWMVLKALEITPELEWETVVMGEPDTWANHETEMKQAGLSPTEIGNIHNIIVNACGLNQDKIEQATQSFLLERREASKRKSSQDTAPSTTPSGVPANAGA